MPTQVLLIAPLGIAERLLYALPAPEKKPNTGPRADLASALARLEIARDLLTSPPPSRSTTGSSTTGKKAQVPRPPRNESENAKLRLELAKTKKELRESQKSLKAVRDALREAKKALERAKRAGGERAGG